MAASSLSDESSSDDEYAIPKYGIEAPRRRQVRERSQLGFVGLDLLRRHVHNATSGSVSCKLAWDRTLAIDTFRAGSQQPLLRQDRKISTVRVQRSSSGAVAMLLGRRAAVGVLASLGLALRPLRSPAADVTGSSRLGCSTASNPSSTIVTCLGFGKSSEGRLQGCAADEACIATSAVRNPSKYGPPWQPSSGPERVDADRAWRSVVAAVGEQPGLKIVEQDDGARYLRATAASVIPPDGQDDVEFVLRDDDGLRLLYRSATRQSVFVYPLQQPVSNQKSHLERLVAIRRRLSWEEAGLPTDSAYLADEMSARYKVPTARRIFGLELGGSRAPSEDDDDY